MRTRMLLSIAALLFVAAGCGATIRSTTAANADLGRYRTYSFFTPPNGPAGSETIVDQTIKSSVKQALAQKGLMEAALGQTPDFLVAHHVKTQQQLDVDPIGYGYYGYGYGWGGADVTTYTQGTLIISFIDPKTKQVFWRGTASDVVNHPESPDTNKLAKVTGEVIERYPAMMAETPRTTM